MNTIQKICFCVVAIFLLATNAEAGRWIIGYSLGAYDPLELSFPKGSALSGNFLTGFNPK
jgi:hypothetical protein